MTRALRGWLRAWLPPAIAALPGMVALAALGHADVEALRARVESIENGEHVAIRGESVGSPVLAEFYASRGFRRVWDDPARADALLRAVRDCGRDGLDPADYHRDALETLAASHAPNDDDLDVLRTDALIRLGCHLLLGKVDPTTLDADWNFGPEIGGFDPIQGIEDIAAAPDLARRLDHLAPSHPLYTRLRDEFARYRVIQAAGGWRPVAAGPALAPGRRDARVPALRARLLASHDLDHAGADSSSLEYDEPLAAAVRRFQARHGIQDDGAVGGRTIGELNVTVEARLEQIRVNLERCRWLLHDVGGTFVVVNIAGYRVFLVRDGAVDWESRVQVGKPYRATPVFRSEMTYLVLNPTWTVPPGILMNDIIPEQRRDPGTLARKKLKVYDATGRRVPASAVN